MLSITLPTALLQIIRKILLNFKVIIKSIIYPDYKFKTKSYPFYIRPKHRNAKIFEKHLIPVCHVGIHWIALAEHPQMSTYVPAFWSFFSFFASFSIG